MAGPSKKRPDTGILSAEYMTSLQKLCRLTTPTVGEVSSIFTGDFRRALGGARARPSVRAEAACAPAASRSSATPSTSRGSKKRGGQSGLRKGRGRKSVAREEPDDEDEPKVEDVGFARPCTWKADSPCWLRDELPEWNRLLAKNFFELQEHSWSEFKFTGYLWSQIDMPEEGATLRVSLLINFLLRHHRCLTRVSVDFAVSELEHEIFWDGIKNGAAAVTFLEYKGTMAQHEGLAPREEYHLWAQSLLSLTNLHSLYLSRVFIDLKVCELLSDFMEDTTTLVTLSLKKIKPEEKVVGCLLEAFTMNKTIKNFYVSEEFAMAKDGQPLAFFVLNHTVIDTLEVRGGGVCVPSALLRAAVLGPSLKCLKIYECKILANDIHEMSKALTRKRPTPEPSTNASSLAWEISVAC
ncbi:uncharacterized protein LOC119372203 [Rhipicephalus sanguineus]|uniref:uncharacterized protein LOC119372203 n=1 Tax=Rhipicephalus sanguineus TaxID=34632 RepID=UPI0020C1FD84|nr:uncharacterized protein LOC119372203 [Rhipicephalus sanguineus]XP_049275522.1 uncharacterized protein LOC119372203 [Rhipicephalus sanguineus]